MLMLRSLKQRGLSLLELLLSMSIGLLLLVALGALMVTSNKLAISRSTSERLDDAARQIFWRLEQDLRRAGYVDTFASSEVLQRAINLRDDAIFKQYHKDKETLTEPQSALMNSVLSFATQGKILPLRGCGTAHLFTERDRTCQNQPTTTAQSLMISYQALRSTSALGHSGLSSEGQEGSKGSQSGAEESCAGTSATNQEPMLTHIYAIKDGGLSCIGIRNALDGNATTQIRSSSQPIMSNVMELMFRYLVVPEAEVARASTTEFNPNQTVHDYLTAREVEQSALGWAGVVAVEICLVLGGENIDGRVDNSQLPSLIPTCQRAEIDSRAPNAAWAASKTRSAGDNKTYQRYQRIIALPNHLHLLNITL